MTWEFFLLCSQNNVCNAAFQHGPVLVITEHPKEEHSILKQQINYKFSYCEWANLQPKGKTLVLQVETLTFSQSSISDWSSKLGARACLFIIQRTYCPFNNKKICSYQKITGSKTIPIQHNMERSPYH